MFVCLLSSPTFLEHQFYALGFDIPVAVTVTFDARGYLAWNLLGIVLFFFDHYIKFGEVIGFRLFGATGLAFAIYSKFSS